MSKWPELYSSTRTPRRNPSSLRDPSLRFVKGTVVRRVRFAISGSDGGSAASQGQQGLSYQVRVLDSRRRGRPIHVQTRRVESLLRHLRKGYDGGTVDERIDRFDTVTRLSSVQECRPVRRSVSTSRPISVWPMISAMRTTAPSPRPRRYRGNLVPGVVTMMEPYSGVPDRRLQR